MSMFLHTDVTAVKLYKKYILAGVGSHINLFTISDQRLLGRKQVLKGQKIYGIIPFGDENKIIIYGGKQFSAIQIDEQNHDGVIVNHLFESILCDDWIICGIWNTLDEIVLLTAHNVVQKWDITKRCIKSQYAGKNNSILYSGLLIPLNEDILVFAGTVFSEVIIHSCLKDEVLHSLLGHKGVIFSIACDPEKELIVTTSDDRSVCVWTPNITINLPKSSLSYWNNIEIICKFKVYGHLARVMRCLISEGSVISVGEDGAICYWDYEGKLVTKYNSHQNGSIWSVDNNEKYLVTGGGDNGLILHPLTLANKSKKSNIIKTSNTVKRLVFTSKGNLILLCDNDDLVYYNIDKSSEMVICKLTQDSSYKLLSISSCKQLISTVDICGNLDVFVENCKYESVNKILSMKLEIGKILSMQWAGNRFLVMCCEMGNISVFGANSSVIQLYAKFVLPKCKERWLTAAAIDETLTKFVCSDRCGNFHFYDKNKIDPIKTIHKVHGSYGATSITFQISKVISTGRDGTIKYFSFGTIIKQVHSLDLNFQWVERFIDNNKCLVCGFQERTFIVYNIKTYSTILQVLCGGGHRAWDINRFFLKKHNNFEEFIGFVYLKQSLIHHEIFKLKNIVSKNVINGGHVKEINCLQVLNFQFNKPNKIIISGSEDTTLRICSLNVEDNYSSRSELTYKHLSSIKCIQSYRLDERRILLISAGGRAQICIKKLQFSEDSNSKIVVESEDLINYMIKGTDKERKGNQSWRNHTIDFDPETRIMDIAIINIDKDIYYVAAGCSDSYLRIFKLNLSENNITLDLIFHTKYHKTCVLKIYAFKFEDSNLLATTSTLGEVVVWSLSDNKDEIINPIFHTKTNKSGINDLAIEVVENNILIATCGDDNAIHIVNLMKNHEDVFIIANQWSTDKYHCSLVSGVVLFNCKYIISVSIDQRVTLSRWSIVDNKIVNEFITQIYSDISDIHGVEVVDINIDYVLICVYGKGMEIIKVSCN